MHMAGTFRASTLKSNFMDGIITDRVPKFKTTIVLYPFNGPIDPAPHKQFIKNQWWIDKGRVPKYEVRVTSDTAPLLKLAILLLSWTEYKGIDLEAIDRERMGTIYDLVTSGKKPSTDTGREQKPTVNKVFTSLGTHFKVRIHFKKESTVYEGAEKWYQAKVIRGSTVDATSDYQVNNPSTFGRLIEDYNHIAGLR